jgi:hypothetical protein
LAWSQLKQQQSARARGGILVISCRFCIIFAKSAKQKKKNSKAKTKKIAKQK